MTQTQAQAELKLYTFDEFMEWYPENSTQRYELHKGAIVEIPPPTGDHADIISFLIEVILAALKRELIDGEYQMTPFRGSDLIVSPTFPQLNLTAQQIFESVSY